MKAFLLAIAFVFSAHAYAQHLTIARLETMSGEKFGYTNAAGAVVIKPRFEAAADFQDGLARVGIGGRFGLIDSTGHEVIPIKYRDIGYFHDGLAGVSLDGHKYGYLNRAGQVVIPCTFDETTDFSEGTAAVARQGRCALLSKKGVLLTPFKYINITPMQGGIARVCVHDDSREGMQYSHFWGFINAQGREISKLTCYGYESPNLENGYAIARLSKPDGSPSVIRTEHYTFLMGKSYTYSSALLDKTGRVVIPASMGYDFGHYGENYLIVEKDNRFGVVDFTGKLILPIGFHEITDFIFGAEGMPLAKAFTTDNGKFFYVNRQFKCVEFDGIKCPEY